MAAVQSLIARRPLGPLNGQARVPGDEATSHQALLCGALAVGRTRITGLLESEDVRRTMATVRLLGAAVGKEGKAWHVTGRGIGGLAEPDEVLDVGRSEMMAHLLAGLLASCDMHAVMTGHAALRRRSMRQVTDPLALCGARFAGREAGCLPLSIQGAADAMPIRCRLPGALTQVKPAILLAGLNARGQTQVWEPVATPGHTEAMLRRFGASVSVQADGAGQAVMLSGQPELRGCDVAVPGSLSCAAFPLVAALLVPGSAVVLAGIRLDPLRAGLLATLREMGADITPMAERMQGDEPVGDLLVRHCTLSAADLPPQRALAQADDYPALAVAAAFARGTTRMAGWQANGGSRLGQAAAMLQAAGVRVTVEGDDLLVHGAGRVPGGCTVEAGMDPWLAMSALVLGQATDAPVAVDDATGIETSFPGFLALMSGLGANIA